MISIVTDSSAYLTRQEAEVLGVTMVSMSYNVDGQAPIVESFVDENGAFDTLIARNMGRLRTSQATLGAFLSTFETLLGKGHQILCVTMSSRLSGTYGNALMAARELDEDRIAVVDSLTTAGAIYLLLLRARAMIDGGAALHEVAAKLTELREKTRTFFSVDDITPLRLSGRLGSVRMSVSTILNIKPLLQVVNGGVVSKSVARGRHEQIRALMKSIAGHKGTTVVQYFAPDAQARSVVAMIEERGDTAIMRRIGPVLGLHLGFGCIGLAWIEEDEG